MDVREKLVELLQDANNPVWKWFPNNMAMLQLADYLIEKGVTVQEWIHMTNPPTEPGEYIVMIKNGSIPTTLLYDGDFWFDEDEDGEFVHYAITHWMPIPEPPKEE